jgi:LysR family transcriptional regulator, transcriptional activator of the cysJI operon
MPLTITQLETFSRLAEVGNFTRVAEELHLTQPAVTQQVRALAEHFGTPLFDMVGRRPVLTDAGTFLARSSREVLSALVTLEREMREFADARSGTLDLGATLTIGNYAILPAVAAFRAAHPGVTIRLTVANTAAMVAALKDRQLALALVEGQVDDEELSVEPYAEDELILIVPARGHALSGVEVIAARDLAGIAFVSREEGSGTRAIAQDALHAAGVAPQIALTIPSGEGVTRAVEAGLGVAILSRLVVERSVAAGRVRAVRIADITLRRVFSIVRLRGRALSPLAARFIETIAGSG